MFVCKVCNNSDPKYIGYKNGEPYCRRCIGFNGEKVSPKPCSIRFNKVFLNLKYPLTFDQEKCSNEVLEYFKKGINVLVHAVCGAGKTELVYKVIKYGIENGLKVGFAIPRKDVVIEITKRLKYAFPELTIYYVIGGHDEHLEGDIVCLTTHQLYRYENYFDLLILDEIDAFPYKDNPVLIEMFKRSVRGNYVLMSATPSKSVIKEFSQGNNKIIKLFKRFHNHPLPVPVIKNGILFDKYFILIKQLKRLIKQNKKVMVFVPTIEDSINVFNFIKLFVKRGEFVNSKITNREGIVDDFRNGIYDYLITTAVLERGVTFKNLQVIIFNSDNSIFTSAALIQISGRVGRVIDAPDGEVIFISERTTNEMKESINEINKINSFL